MEQESQRRVNSRGKKAGGEEGMKKERMNEEIKDERWKWTRMHGSTLLMWLGGSDSQKNERKKCRKKYNKRNKAKGE